MIEQRHPLSLADRMDPAELFGHLWPVVEPFGSILIDDAWIDDSYVEYGAFYGRLLECNTEHVPVDIISYLRGGARTTWLIPPENVEQRAFIVMRAIDRAFRFVLPNTAYKSPGTPGPGPGMMLRRMKDRWFIEGCLFESEAGYVMLLGPLLNKNRAEEPNAGNGDVFANQFTNITMASRLKGRRRLGFRTLTPSQFSRDVDLEHRIGVAPIAQDADDLVFHTTERGNTCYLHAAPANSDAVAKRAAHVVTEMLADNASLIALPELVLDPDSTEHVRETMRGGAHDGGRVVVLGSGLSAEGRGAHGLHYNEAVICDGRGAVLFRQRKMNHYSMDAERMADCAIPFHRKVAHVENSASGEELVICDLYGMGRLMVLICEDLAQDHPGATVIKEILPDWVVTPILDLSLTPGRWPHHYATALNKPARVVVSGSTTLSVRKAKGKKLRDLEAKAGVAMLFDGAVNKAVRIVRVESLTGVDAWGVVDWDPENWRVTKLTDKDRSEPYS